MTVLARRNAGGYGVEERDAQVKKFADAPVLNCCAVSIIVQVAKGRRVAREQLSPSEYPRPSQHRIER